MMKPSLRKVRNQDTNRSLKQCISRILRLLSSYCEAESPPPRKTPHVFKTLFTVSNYGLQEDIIKWEDVRKGFARHLNTSTSSDLILN